MANASVSHCVNHTLVMAHFPNVFSCILLELLAREFQKQKTEFGVFLYKALGVGYINFSKPQRQVKNSVTRPHNEKSCIWRVLYMELCTFEFLTKLCFL